MSSESITKPHQYDTIGADTLGVIMDAIRPLGPEQAAELMAEMTRRENAEITREEEATDNGDK